MKAFLVTGLFIFATLFYVTSGIGSYVRTNFGDSSKFSTNKLRGKEGPSDPLTTKETKNLFKYLNTIRMNATLFGQQYAMVRGVNGPMSYGKSEIYDITGDYPAVYGWDFGDVFKRNVGGWKRGREIPDMKLLIKEAYERGGIHTFSYHMSNPVTQHNSWDTTKAVSAILPGGYLNEQYKRTLDTIADYYLSLKGKNGELIPVIHRPFHEHNGRWFWWGKPHASKEEFIQLWRFSIDYLRKEKKVHNLLVGYSPDTVATEAEYLEYYPGDEYVDVMGLDIYRDVENQDIKRFQYRLKLLVNLAEKHGKIPALTETGYSVRTVKDWYTAFLLEVLKGDKDVQRLAYALIWGNFSKEHYFSIFPGHFNEENFRKFEKDPFIYFEKDLKGVY